MQMRQLSRFAFILVVPSATCSFADTPKSDPAPAQAKSAVGSLLGDGKTTVVGALSKDQISKTIKSNRPAMRSCYAKALERRPGVEGTVTVHFSIGATGEVTGADVAEQTIQDEQMATCVVDAVKSWKFPAPKGGGKVVVTYPFIFNPDPAPGQVVRLQSVPGTGRSDQQVALSPACPDLDAGLPQAGICTQAVLSICGTEVVAYRFGSGLFFTNELPYQQFKTVEELAKAVKNHWTMGTSPPKCQ